jgi:hypothetical protein
LNTAVVSVSVKSDRLPKKFPKMGEMVRMGDRKGLFMVTRVDVHLRVADLVQRVGRIDVVQENVPFQLIRTVPRQASRAIQQFLHS